MNTLNEAKHVSIGTENTIRVQKQGMLQLTIPIRIDMVEGEGNQTTFSHRHLLQLGALPQGQDLWALIPQVLAIMIAI